MSLDTDILAGFLRAANKGKLSNKEADAVAASLAEDGFDSPAAYTSLNILGATMRLEYEALFFRAATTAHDPDVRALALRNLCARLALADKYTGIIHQTLVDFLSQMNTSEVQDALVFVTGCCLELKDPIHIEQVVPLVTAVAIHCPASEIRRHSREVLRRLDERSPTGLEPGLSELAAETRRPTK